jgi:hypothetical protein
MQVRCFIPLEIAIVAIIPTHTDDIMALCNAAERTIREATAYS